MSCPRFQPPISLLPRDGEALYYPGFFSPEEILRYEKHLNTEIAWTQTPIVIFGKSILQPRLTALYGDKGKDLRYSGQTMLAFPWTTPLLEIKRRVEQIAEIEFTTVLLNQYRDERDSMGWHRDNEKALGPLPTIASVSFGASRGFQFRHYRDKKLKVGLALESGSLLVMKGECQNAWEHSLPKLTKPVGVRINLTFRRIQT